jgi:uncharacterized OB-fold protein
MSSKGTGMTDTQTVSTRTPPKSVRRPGLVTTPLTEPFWDRANEGELLIQHCSSCGHRQHYPRNICISCWADEPLWMSASGNGVVWTFTVVEKPGHPAWVDEVPYVIALVELEEGPRVMTRIVDYPPELVSVGMPVSLAPTWDEQLKQMLLSFAPAVSE